MSDQTERRDRISDIERAALQQRLSEQAIFQQVLDAVRRRYRMLIFCTATALGGVALIWVLMGCPALHQIDWCPWASQWHTDTPRGRPASNDPLRAFEH